MKRERFVVAIPSYKRSGLQMKARAVFPNAVLCVHKCDAAQYQAHNGGQIAVMPDSLRGNMAKVRNWILAEMDSEWVVMCDDDVTSIGFREGKHPHTMTVDQVRDFVTNGFVMAEDVGAYLWGVNVNEARKFYREFGPLSFTSPVLGTFSAIRRNPLRYDPRLSLNEDYDYALQHLHRYRKVMRLTKYHYIAEHVTKAGGCGVYRTLDAEQAQAAVMRRKWGEEVVRYDFARSINPIVKAPIRGI